VCVFDATSDAITTRVSGFELFDSSLTEEMSSVHQPPLVTKQNAPSAKIYLLVRKFIDALFSSRRRLVVLVSGLPNIFG
jgi:hypothetical protein